MLVYTLKMCSSYFVHVWFFSYFCRVLNSDIFPSKMLRVCLVCVICNSNSIRSFIFIFSSPVMNLKIFATVHSLMNGKILIDSCQAYLPTQYASNIEFIHQKWRWWRDWQRATPESHVQNKLLVCFIGCPCSHWLFRFSVLHSTKTVNTIRYLIENCFVS